LILTFSYHIYDFTDNQHHLTFTGEDFPDWLNPGDVPSGLSGMRFDGLDDAFSDADPNGDLMDDNLTLMAWVYRGQNQSNVSVIMTRSGPGFNSSLHYWLGMSAGSVFVATNNFTEVATMSPSQIPVDEWSHIAVTISFTDSEIKIYVNGIKQAVSGSGFLTRLQDQGDEVFRIGRLQWRYFNITTPSKICEASVHKGIKSDEFIASHSSLPEDFNDKVLDNGDRLVLLNYSIMSTRCLICLDLTRLNPSAYGHLARFTKIGGLHRCKNIFLHQFISAG